MIPTLLLALAIRPVRVLLTDSPVSQARAYAAQKHEYRYQVGLLWSQNVEQAGDAPTTVLTLSDPLRPLLEDIVTVRLCGDQSARFRSIEHNWFVLVYTRTSQRKSIDCRGVVAIYPIQAPEAGQ